MKVEESKFSEKSNLLLFSLMFEEILISNVRFSIRAKIAFKQKGTIISKYKRSDSNKEREKSRSKDLVMGPTKATSDRSKNDAFCDILDLKLDTLKVKVIKFSDLQMIV